MGVITEAPKAERESPDFPDELSVLYGHYKRLRFGVCYGETLTLVARKPLRYAEIESYSRLINWQPTSSEVEIIMDIDAIFEMREVQ